MVVHKTRQFKRISTRILYEELFQQFFDFGVGSIVHSIVNNDSSSEYIGYIPGEESEIKVLLLGIVRVELCHNVFAGLFEIFDNTFQLLEKVQSVGCRHIG